MRMEPPHAKVEDLLARNAPSSREMSLLKGLSWISWLVLSAILQVSV
jgi:hypothetical protein